MDLEKFRDFYGMKENPIIKSEIEKWSFNLGLKNLRERLRVTQKQFAQELGISVPLCWKLDTGRSPLGEDIRQKLVNYCKNSTGIDLEKSGAFYGMKKDLTIKLKIEEGPSTLGLKNLRKKLGFTQEKFAQELGISKVYYGKLENKVCPVRGKIHKKIGDYFLKRGYYRGQFFEQKNGDIYDHSERIDLEELEDFDQGEEDPAIRLNVELEHFEQVFRDIQFSKQRTSENQRIIEEYYLEEEGVQSKSKFARKYGRTAQGATGLILDGREQFEGEWGREFYLEGKDYNYHQARKRDVEKSKRERIARINAKRKPEKDKSKTDRKPFGLKAKEKFKMKELV